ncbi:hypothetical protein [Bosea sp. (in: a-proteobacteria)]|uniref:hypothetical protein n=1 Tax=Bosea sp. (in: a-proteobacteria) TaxID=1871050 RepID=UPI00403353CF
MEQLTAAHAALTVAHATLTTELLSSLINKHIQALYEYLYEHSQQVRALKEELVVLVQVLVQCLDVLVDEGGEKRSCYSSTSDLVCMSFECACKSF